MARSMAKKAASAVKKVVGAAKKVARKTAKAAKKAVGAGKKTAGKAKAAKKTTAKPSKKALGDVIGVSRARVPAGTPRATTDRGGNPKGIEIGPQAKGPALLKRSRARF